MDVEITPTPPTPDGQPTERQLKRRRDVERLLREGRACGAPSMGYKLTGKPGNRRLVPDEEEREIMAIVVHSRDKEGQSFDQASDTVEEYRAAKEGRQPRSRGFRDGWSGRTCHRAYLAAKKLAEEGEPVPTHRRCSDCKESLPIEQFTTRGKTCLTCRITKPLKKFEERVGATSADYIGKRRNGPRPSPAAEIQHRVNGLVQDLERLAKRGSGAELLEAINSFSKALNRDLAITKPIEGMSQAELERTLSQQIRRELRPILTQIQAELEIANSSQPDHKTEDNP